MPQTGNECSDGRGKRTGAKAKEGEENSYRGV